MGGIGNHKKEAALDEPPSRPNAGVIPHSIQSQPNLVSAEQHDAEQQVPGDSLSSLRAFQTLILGLILHSQAARIIHANISFTFLTPFASASASSIVL